MKFLVDMPLSPGLVTWLSEHGHDAVNLGLHRAPDSEIVALARLEGRTVVTADLDYPRLLALARATEPSVILFRDGDWSEADVISRIEALLAALSAAEIADSIIVVERDRVRRRRLPIGP